jgi:ABC-type branched-subunit amino acid transport system substrate-binding protein
VTGNTETADGQGLRENSLAFRDSHRIIRLIGALYQRPRFGDRPRELGELDGEWHGVWGRKERQARQGLPMLNLIHPADPGTVLPAVADLLAEAQPRGVRYAHVRPPESLGTAPAGATGDLRDPADVLAIRQILLHARNGLINCPKVRDSQPKFPLFSLVVLLMNRSRKSRDLNLESALLRDLQELGLYWRFRNFTNAVKKELPDDRTTWKLPIYLIQAVTWGLFRAAVTGRVPLLSGRYRWFLRQPHLAPEMSGTFVRFATRLTEGQWQQEAPEYVARLLVNTFLEDLRRAYRLRPWQIFRRRRMTYPVLLLDGITPTNGGYALLRLLNDVRNQVGVFDPLLVVSFSEAAPPTGATTLAARGGSWAGEAYVGYRRWQNQLFQDRRARQPTTWYLPIWIPGPPTEDDRREARQQLDSFQRYTVPRRAARPTLLASRWLRLGTVVVVLAAGLVGSLAWYRAHCDSWQSTLTATGDECIGVTDGSFDIFQPSDKTIQTVEQTIYQQNLSAEQKHAQNPQRPYITLVDVEAVTSSDGTADGLTAERESLEGVAVAQSRQLTKSGSSDPIVRLLIANAGRNMLRGTLVAQQLQDMAARDAGLVGVVGLDMSSSPTVSTINALAEAGLPMVAATLTADDLTQSNPMYFQVAPQNRREAAVAAAFADQQQRTTPGMPRSVRVYYSDDATDTYSANLRDDVLNAFAARGFRTSAVAFTPSGFTGGAQAHLTEHDPLAGNAHAAGQDTCSQGGYVFFAGRGVPDYGDFLDGASQCDSRAVFLGGDDVSRYVANSTLRQQYRALSYYYMSLDPAPTGAPQGPERDFYGDLDDLFPFELSQQGRSLDGHAALSYDAALVMITATEYLRQGALVLPVTPGNVWREITDIHTSQAGQPGDNNAIQGVTGAIDYGGDITRHVPMAKTMAVLQVADGQVQAQVAGFCGAGGTQSAWCPPGS